MWHFLWDGVPASFDLRMFRLASQGDVFYVDNIFFAERILEQEELCVYLRVSLYATDAFEEEINRETEIFTLISDGS